MATKHWLSICIVLSILLLQAEASATKNESKGPLFETKRNEEVRPMPLLGRGADLIAISPCTSNVVFEASYFQPEDSYRGPGGGQATVSITARSPLPRWGVCVESPVLQGPEGDLPPDRIWVRSAATENILYPLDHPIPILFGGGRTGPYGQVTFEMQLRPTWLDKPGRYRGHIIVRPFLPGVEGVQLTDASRDERLGRAQTIPVEFEIPEAILTSFSGAELKFKTDAGPGEYSADHEVRLTLTTNAPRWRVDYQGSPLASKDSEVPLERMSWERVDKFGRVEERGRVGTDKTVASGSGPIEDLEIRLRIKVQIMLQDPPGDYGGTISLVGMTDH